MFATLQLNHVFHSKIGIGGIEMTTASLGPGPAATDMPLPSTAAMILAPLATVLLAVALRLPTRSETLGPIIGVLASGIVELIAQIALWLAMAWLIKRSFSLAVLHYSAHRRRAVGLRVFEGGAKLLTDLVGVALFLGALFGIVGIVLDQPIGDLLATSGVFAAIIGLATEGVHEDPAPIALIDEYNDRGVRLQSQFLGQRLSRSVSGMAAGRDHGLEVSRSGRARKSDTAPEPGRSGGPARVGPGGRLREFLPETVVVSEGDAGDSLYDAGDSLYIVVAPECPPQPRQFAATIAVRVGD
jgi:hypothetical protein